MKVCAWLCLISSFCAAQSTSTLLGARAAGMGYASSTLRDEWSFFGNAAGLSSEKNYTAATTYEARALPGGNRMGLVGVMPLKFGVGAVGIFRFGDDVYSEQSVQAAFAHQIGKTSLGVRVNYMQYRTIGFGTHGFLGIHLGGITQLTKQISIGAWIQNINMPKLKFHEKETAPVKLLASVGFKPIDKFILAAEVEKDILYEPLWKVGMEYQIHKKVFVRSGFNLNPGVAFFGIGFQSWRVKIDYALQSFSAIGPTHQASASYRINKISKDQK